MVDPVDDPHSPDLLAAELALGLLDGRGRAAAARRVLADPEFAAAVEEWRLRLADLALDSGTAAPPDLLWERIEAAIDAQDSAPPAHLVPRRTLRWWQAGTALSAMAAAVLAALLFVPRPEIAAPTPPPAPVGVAARPAIVAQLRGEGEGPVVAARYDPATARLRLVAQDMAPGALAPELWIIPADGVPRSLGVIHESGDTMLPVAQGHRAMLHDGATLAVTMEPRATAPHAAPSGPPVVSGKIFGI